MRYAIANASYGNFLRSTRIRRSAPPIAEGLGGGEAAGDRREQSVNLGLLLDVLLED